MSFEKSDHNYTSFLFHSLLEDFMFYDTLAKRSADPEIIEAAITSQSNAIGFASY